MYGPQYVKKNAEKKLIGSSKKKIPGTDVNEPRRPEAAYPKTR
jgi:hypothetical protein